MCQKQHPSLAMRVLAALAVLALLPIADLGQNPCYTLVNATGHTVVVFYQYGGNVIPAGADIRRSFAAGESFRYCFSANSATALIETVGTVWEGDRPMIMGQVNGAMPAGIYRMIPVGGQPPPPHSPTPPPSPPPPNRTQTPISSGFAAVEISGTPYVWAYRASDGRVAIHEITPGVGTGFTQKSISTWDTGFSSFVGLSIAGTPYVWAYRASDGRVAIHEITPGVETGFTQKSISTWDTGFSSFVGLSVAGTPYVWAYRASDGRVAIHEITPGVGTGFTQKSISTWDKDF